MDENDMILPDMMEITGGLCLCKGFKKRLHKHMHYIFILHQLQHQKLCLC